MSQLDISHRQVTLPDLPSELDGFTIAQLSDLHVGIATHWVPRWAPEAADEVLSHGADVVVNTGDFLWKESPVSKARAYAARFVLRKPGGDPHSTNLAILGNHDYYASVEVRSALIAELEDAGIDVLTNEGVCVKRGAGAISFVGLTDEDASFEQGLAVLQQCARPRVALVHVPDLVEKIPRGAADLVLAGHTHGGQFTLPFLESTIVRHGCGSNYVEGFYTINDMPVYVNRGLGCTGLPVRFRARPEVTFIRLTR